MNLQVSHETVYRFSEPVHYGLQRIRLTPIAGPTQTVGDWSLSFDNCREEVSYTDHFGNVVHLVQMKPDTESLSIVASGSVATHRSDGVIGLQDSALPLSFFTMATPLTTPGAGVRRLVSTSANGGDQVAQLHQLSATVRAAVDYRLGDTDAKTTAEQAVSAASGVCQDHAHIFAAAGRSLGFPVRYVSGYLLLDSGAHQTAGHAWAEAWVDGLGWVGFDVSNGISIDERYIRVAVGRDYLEAAPVSGVRYGPGLEQMDVALDVQQAPQ